MVHMEDRLGCHGRYLKDENVTPSKEGCQEGAYDDGDGGTRYCCCYRGGSARRESTTFWLICVRDLYVGHEIDAHILPT